MAQKIVRRRATLTIVNPSNPDYALRRGLGDILPSATDAALMSVAQEVVKAIPGDQLGGIQLTITADLVPDDE
ncbi:hypothetical protein ACFQ3L_04620 [Lacticaseibacillus jixianensis]|uniref:Uncharacterized protein n=1 Tax=Lacticaseibacillus jixianensis TaxID=2486012 RepID=A0ABW4B7S7_9LACO|nr:hypothetical protein [Lacticaseibacillus jixianensis]